MRKSVPVQHAHLLPFWQRPSTLLGLMAFAMPLAFSTWMALLNNFMHDVAGFDGGDVGWLQSVREIPGFLAIGVIAVLYLMREQTLALISLILLGLGVGATALFPSFGGLLLTTFVSSVGFHYYETVKQSLELQWIDKLRAPRVLGTYVAIGSGASLIAYGGIMLAWKLLGWDFSTLYIAGGGITIAIAIFIWFAYPHFESETVQHRHMLLRKRYWLYYVMQFMAGARRQIFIVFAAFMMVEKFGFQVHQVTALFLINYVANMVFAPIMGGVVARFGERAALVFEYAGLIGVFATYAGIYYFDWSATLAAVLYVVDHLFFALAFAQKTYFQKIADPRDIAPTAAVAFTINHIAAVFLPAGLGLLWLVSPAAVFVVAALLAFASLMLALMIPRHPQQGNETVFSGLLPVRGGT